jgi:hypothetical protein
MRRIESRLRKLEAQVAIRDRPTCDGVACVMHGVSEERRKNMSPNERIVVDWFRNRDHVTEGRKRITADPTDQGRKCTRNGYLLDVIEELHQSCFHREKPGHCWVCQDTPVAENKVSDPPTDSEEGSIPSAADLLLYAEEAQEAQMREEARMGEEVQR